MLTTKEYAKEYYNKNKERLRSIRLKYYNDNKEYLCLKGKEYRKKNPQSGHKSKLKLKYNITIEQYNILFDMQQGKCKICNKIETCKNQGTIMNLSVDHCHKTGKIRGLLCHKCNKGLGLFGDNSKITLFNAYMYLINSEEIL